MVKVYLPSFAVCALSLTVNLFVLGIHPLRAVAQESASQTSKKQDNKQEDAGDSANVEPEILAEINRVRTNPQGYAHWLEDQKQYYDNIWLRLPGEKPIRAHRLEKAIDEAIAELKEQPPLPPLSTSEQTSASASEKLEDFATASKNIQNISYGRTTAKGIVMSLVVDELFPDRRRRKKLLNPTAEDTGVVCQNDPRYAKVCAIAYSYPEVEDTEDKQPENSNSPLETETIARQENKLPKDEPNSTNIKPKTPETDPKLDTVADNTAPEDTNIALETLPDPPVIPELPSTPKPPATDLPEAKTEETNAEVEEGEKDTAIKETDSKTIESNEEIAQDENTTTEAEVSEISEIEDANDVVNDPEKKEEEEEVVEVFEVEETEAKIATNSSPSRLLENVERGALEEGDRIIAEDGSFYDSYPLEAKSGESFTIALESEDFDAFVALIDVKGNIIEQNDDISEEDSNSRIRVDIPENGTYNVIVNAYDKGGSGQYILTISR